MCHDKKSKMDKLFVFLTTLICMISSSFANHELCRGVTPLKRNPYNSFSTTEKLVLYRISRNASFTTITDFATCSHQYLEDQKCKSVTVEFSTYFLSSCTNKKNGQIIQNNVVRFINTMWSEDIDGNLMLIKQELESADNILQIYRTKRVIVKKASLSNPFAVDMRRQNDLINYYLKTVIAITEDASYYTVFQICNTPEPILMIFVTNDIYNPQRANFVMSDVDAYFQDNDLDVKKFITLTEEMDIPSYRIENVPYMNIDTTPPIC